MTTAETLAPMADPQVKLAIHSEAVPDKDWVLVGLEGGSAISKPYRFTLRILSQNADLDFDAILAKPVSIAIDCGNGPEPLHGFFSEFTLVEAGPRALIYEGQMVPKLWYLSLPRHNQIFQNKTVREIVADVLKANGFASEDYEDRCKASYSKLEFTVQYEETDLDFVSRLLEHHGIFYFWEHGDKAAKLVFGDAPSAHKDFAKEPKVPYVQPSAMVSPGVDSDKLGSLRTVRALSMQQSTLARSVTVKDYNYRNPNLPLVGQAQIDPKGRGMIMSYGAHVKTDDEAGRIAKVRAEELRCSQRLFRGRSDCASFAPGRLFTLEDHPRSAMNQQYLLCEVVHHASQSHELASAPESAGYRNEFTAIPAKVPFRPRRDTPKPRIHGVMHAQVDGAGSDEYAEIDEVGRYRVRLPLDLSDAPAGGASRWVRMAQPYAGAEYGMHFPLHKGTEVILTFVDGDIDRPIIAGAVPNALTPSPVKSENHKKSVIRTGGENYIAMYDEKGSERIKMGTPRDQTFMQLGAPNLDSAGLAYGTGANLLSAAKGMRVDITGEDVSAWAKKYFCFTEGAHMIHSNHGVTIASGSARNGIQWALDHLEHVLKHFVDSEEKSEDQTAGRMAKAYASESLVYTAVETAEGLAFALIKAIFLKERIKPVSILKSAALSTLLATLKLHSDGDISAIAMAGNFEAGSLAREVTLFGREIQLAARKEVAIAASSGEVLVSGHEAVNVKSKGTVEVGGKEQTTVGKTITRGAVVEPITSAHTVIIAEKGIKADAEQVHIDGANIKKIREVAKDKVEIQAGDYRIVLDNSEKEGNHVSIACGDDKSAEIELRGKGSEPRILLHFKDGPAIGIDKQRNKIFIRNDQGVWELHKQKIIFKQQNTKVLITPDGISLAESLKVLSG